MNYVLWFNKCKNDRGPLAVRLADTRNADLVRFVTWSSDFDLVSPYDRFVCSCDICKQQLSLVLLRCSERTLDVALDAEPVMVERERHSDDYSNNTFVHYSFAHPSAVETRALLLVLAHTDAHLLYVTTTYDTVTGSEDPSVYKINIVRRKTPDCERQVEWMAGRIKAVTNCTSYRFETRYVTYFSPFTGDECAVQCPTAIADRRTSLPRTIDSLHAVRRERSGLR